MYIWYTGFICSIEKPFDLTACLEKSLNFKMIHYPELLKSIQKYIFHIILSVWLSEKHVEHVTFLELLHVFCINMGKCVFIKIWAKPVSSLPVIFTIADNIWHLQGCKQTNTIVPVSIQNTFTTGKVRNLLHPKGRRKAPTLAPYTCSKSSRLVIENYCQLWL